MRLKEARENRGLTQEQVASAMGIPKRTYQGYERGERDPSSDFLVMLADYYQMSLDDLVGRNETVIDAAVDAARKMLADSRCVTDPKRQRMIDIYDAMTPQGRALMLSMAEDMLPYFKK